jgi:glucokinase
MFIGIDIGGSLVKIAFREENRVRFWIKPTTLVEDPAGWFERLIRRLPQWVYRAFQSGKLRGVGIGVPGEVQDPGVVVQSPHLPRWRKIPLASILSRELGVPVLVENDAHMAALGVCGFSEKLGIPSRGNLFVFTLGSGVGGGWILSGKLYRQPLGGEMEIGHAPLGTGERICTCGRQGCVEAYTGGVSLLKRYAEEGGGSLNSVRELIERAREGDRLALKLLDEAGIALGRASAWVSNLLSTQTFFFCGGVSFARRFLYPSLKREYLRHTFPSWRRKTRFYFPPYRDRLGALGALFAAEMGENYRFTVAP